MKIFKDKFMEWLDNEIKKSDEENGTFTLSSRRDVLIEIKNKLEQIIQEEFEKDEE